MSTPRLVALRGDESDLCARHHQALRRAVTSRVHISADLVEDACQQAWMILLRRQPDRGPTLFGWLVTVATREGYRLSATDRRDIRLDVPARGEDDDTTLAQLLAAPQRLDTTLEARRALRALAALPERQRRYALLKTAGLSYREIAEAQDVTYTNVNKHLAKASRRLKAAAEHAA